jgi:tetratricopeptide (TPR) repeat protein
MVRGTVAGDLEWLDDQGQATHGGVPQAHRGAVLAVVITRDGQTVVSAGADGTLRRWDRRGNALGEAMVSQDSPLVALALSPDGQTLISGRADGLVEQWSVVAGTPLGNPIAAHAAAIQTLDYMAGGQNWITGSQDGSVALWNADGSRAGQIALAHGGGVTQVVSSPDGQVMATTGGDGTLRFWDRVTLQPRGETLPAHDAPIQAVAYSPDGRTLATAAADGTLRLWNADGSSQWSEPVTLESDPRFLGFTPAGDLVVGTVDGRVERRGPQGDVIVVTRAQSAAADSTSSPGDSLSPLQRLPQNTWWILAAVPALLILAGAVGALLGGNRSENEDDDEPLETDSGTTSEAASDAVAAVIDAKTAGSEPTQATTIEPGQVGAIPHPQPDDQPPRSMSPDLPPEADLQWDKPGEDIARTVAAESTAAFATESGSVPVVPPPSVDVPFSANLPPEADLVTTGETVPQPPTSKLEQARADLAGGRKQLRAAQYDAALLCFNSAIEATEVERLKAGSLGTPLGGINALATQAQTQRGHALGLMDQAGEAMESYNTALALDSSGVEAWIGKGRLLIALGRYEEALFCFDSALEIDSSLGPAWAGKGQALLRLGRYAEGQTCHNRALALGIEGMGPFPPYPTLDPATLEAADVDLTWPGAGGAVLGNDAVQSSAEVGYDPDIPQDLQQMVMGLPSADTDLAYAFPSDYGVPPELAAEAAQLPSQAEDSTPPAAMDWLSEQGTLEQETTMPAEVGTAPWIRPAPVEESPDQGLDLSTATVDPAASSVTSQGMPSGEPLSPWQRPDAAPSPLEDDLIRRIDLSVATNWDAEQGWPTPKATALDPTALTEPDPSPTVPSHSGDFVPPAEFDEDWPQDLPPEVLAAMASIPAGSPDAFGGMPSPENLDLVPGNRALPAQSWLQLTLDRAQGPRFYALWHIDDGDRLQAKQAGGDILAVRLYDVTGHPTQTPLPPPVEEQRCHDDFAQDWYLSIPRWDRIYLAEIGYLSSTGHWQTLARSTEVPTIAA